MQIVKELEVVETDAALHPQRRVVIIQREDGRYSYAEQYYFVSEYEGNVIAEGWGTLPAAWVHDTPETAETEGRAAFARLYS